MSIIFDPYIKRIILDSETVTGQQIYSRWCDWLIVDDNIKHAQAFRISGGEDLGDGLSNPPYFFLLNNWRIRPMEASHNLNIIGNVRVDGGGSPVVNTLGAFQVNVSYTVAMQAQAVVSASAPATIAEAVRLSLTEELARILEIGNKLAVINSNVKDASLSVPATRDL